MQEIEEILEKIIDQEINTLFDHNRHNIREKVKTSLITKLRLQVRECIQEMMEELVQRPESKREAEEKKCDDMRRQPGETTMIAEPKSQVSGSAPSPDQQRESDHISLSGRYIYCIAEENDQVSFGNMGLEGSALYTVSCNGLCVLVHDCRAEPYQSENPEIVKSWVMAHQQVVDEAAKKFGNVIPMGFDTIIRGNGEVDADGQIRNWLKEESENLKTKLKKLRDRREFGVQIFADTRVITQTIAKECDEVRKLEQEIKSKPKGAAYMFRQKLGDLVKKELDLRINRCFKEFYGKIKPNASDLHIEKVKKLEEKDQVMLINLSCLLSRKQEEAMGEALEQIEELEGFSVRFTGPWPPYSFV